MTAELFAQWHLEIAADLEASRQELAAAEAALADAETAHRTARVHARAMQVALAKLVPDPSPWSSRYAPTASALRVRIDDHMRSEHSAAGAVSRARGHVEALRHRIADFTLALEQINLITAPPVDESVTDDASAIQAEAA